MFSLACGPGHHLTHVHVKPSFSWAPCHCVWPHPVHPAAPSGSKCDLQVHTRLQRCPAQNPSNTFHCSQNDIQASCSESGPASCFSLPWGSSLVFASQSAYRTRAHSWLRVYFLFLLGCSPHPVVFLLTVAAYPFCLFQCELTVLSRVVLSVIVCYVL